MSSFSSLLDISSFFIGVLVNLLLVAMICFYFKRKIDNLEISQSEQAKMLFQIIQEQSMVRSNPVPSPGQVQSDAQMYGMLNGLDLSQLNSEGEDEGVVKDNDDSNNDNNEENESSSEEEDSDDEDDNKSVVEDDDDDDC